MKATTNFTIAVLAMLFIFSCSKENISEQETKGNSAIEKTEVTPAKIYTTEDVESIMEVEQSIQILDNFISEKFNFFTGEKNVDRFGCGEISFKEHFWKVPNVLTINVENECVTVCGDTVSGKIVITYSDFMYKEGAERTIQYDNFTINGSSINALITRKNLGKNENGILVCEEEMSKGTLTENGETIYHSYHKELAFECLSDIFDMDKKNIIISGYSSGTTFSGASYSSSIKEDLNMSLICGCINEGVRAFNFNEEGESVQFSIDFGDKTCEAEAVVYMPEEGEKILHLCK